MLLLTRAINAFMPAVSSVAPLSARRTSQPLLSNYDDEPIGLTKFLDGGGAGRLLLTEPTQVESENMGMRDWPQITIDKPFDDNCEDGALRYVLEGSGTVSCGGDTLPVAVGTLVQGRIMASNSPRPDAHCAQPHRLAFSPVLAVGGDTSSEFAPRAVLRWTPDADCDELLLLTPEYKGLPLLPVFGGFFVVFGALIASTLGAQ